jgi:YebC/PmpR family DNA-binding regulatory protein
MGGFFLKPETVVNAGGFMSGHSHWAGIKHRKGAADAKRGKLFSKLAKQITIAARHGGGDPAMNLSLRYAIDRAKASSMPKDNIERALKKGTGEIEGAALEEVRYEGYAPAGVAIIVQVLTDNRNRTSAEIRKIFEKCGGNLGTANCVSFMFENKGLITIKTDVIDEDSLMEVALDAGAENFEKSGDIYEITTTPQNFDKVKTAVEAKKIPTETSEITNLPTTKVTLDENEARKVLNLLDQLEEHDDVQNIYSNYDIPDEIFSKLASAM